MSNTANLNGKPSGTITPLVKSDLTTIDNTFSDLSGTAVVASVDIGSLLKYEVKRTTKYLNVWFKGTGVFTNSKTWHVYGSWDGGTTLVQMTSTALFTITSSVTTGFAQVDLNMYVAPHLYIGQAVNGTSGNAGTSGILYVSCL